MLWPALAKLLPAYPDITVEIVVDYGLTNIVAERYDAGVRLGEQVAQRHDRGAHRTGHADGGGRLARLLGPTPAPEDAAGADGPSLHQSAPADLRWVYAWEFEKGGRELKVRVEGPLVFNNLALQFNAVLSGLGLAYLPEDQVRPPSRRGNWFVCLPTGARPFQAIISTIRAVGSRHPPLRCWWIPCGTVGS